MHLVKVLEQKYFNPLYKKLLISAFKESCMICLSQAKEEKRKIKVYKDNLFRELLSIKHLEHFVCGECDKLRTK